MITAAGKLHPRYKPLHVVTGRLASENPNIQQVPRDPRFRGVFGGVDGYSWVKVDLSQIELRLAAWTAEETTMLAALDDGHDLHAMTAEAILGDTAKRQTGKALNFSLLYGAYPKKLQEIAARDYGVEMTLEEAEAYHKRFFETYPHLKWWHQDMEASILATGRSESPLGRLRILPDAFSSDRALQNRAVREGINHPIQSFASDLMLMSLVRVNREFPGYVVATVHDELDLVLPNRDVDHVVPRVVAIMQDTTWLERWGIDLKVPIIAEATIGRYWNGD
jgi:DNA polymerase-1